jgi:DNA replication protein DnaC
MLANTTIEGLKTLRLDAMAAALADQHQQAAYSGLGFEERLGLLVDRELTERGNRRLERCLKAARLRTPATIEDIDFRHPRGLDRAQILTLAQAHWAQHHHAIVITGPTGAGKTYLACALAHAAIRNGHTAVYLRAPRMFDDLAIARADGRLARLMATWARAGVLVVDDLLLRPLTADQAADLLEVIEDRARLRATIITSQLPVSHWHEAIGDPTIADAALDRLLENAHRIALTGESMRRAADGTRSRQASKAGNAKTPVPAPEAGRS